MNTSIVISVINIIGSLALLIGGEFLLVQNTSLLDTAVESVTAICTLLAILVPIIWHGINRLNSLDDLEGLKDEHIKLIQLKVRSIKKTLYFRSVWILLTVFLLFIFSKIRSFSPLIEIILSIIIPFALSTFWTNTISFIGFFISIDQLRQKVAEIKKKEKARRKLIDELLKDRHSQPLQSDPYLESYRKVFDDQQNQPVDLKNIDHPD